MWWLECINLVVSFLVVKGDDFFYSYKIDSDDEEYYELLYGFGLN